MMNRRSFLSTILALGVAPAIVRANSLMRIVPRGLLVDPYFHSVVQLAHFDGVEGAYEFGESEFTMEMWYSDLRVSNGVARYISRKFTPAEIAFPDFNIEIPNWPA